MNLWRKALNVAGWKIDISAPRHNKCVICVAPHTSNLDFFLGLAAYRSLGRKANFLMKSFWFFFPFGILIRSLGGIAVRRKNKKQSLTSTVVEQFAEEDYLNLAVTPEGTRSATSEWHTGFLRIATQANVPVQLGIIDYKDKMIIIRDEFHPSGDIDADMKFVKNYYSLVGNVARYPEKFIV